MKILKALGLSFAGLIVLVIVVSLFLPGNYKVTRSVVINAPAEAVFPQVNCLRNWAEWTSWNQEDPTINMIYEGPAEGVGCRQSWTSENSGEGTITITESVPGQAVRYDQSFPGLPTSRGSILLVESGSGTEVTWSDEGTLGKNPLFRYLGLFVDRIVGPEFDRGLANLKQRVESLPPPASGEGEEEKAETGAPTGTYRG